ncbi:MAG: sensor histidine kinase [Acidimicrobiales bacterium]
MADRTRRQRLASVRVRTTAAATLTVAAALGLGGFLLVGQFAGSLRHNQETAAVSRAEDIAALASSGHLPAMLALPGQDATFAQVVGRSGTVVAASTNIAGEPPIGPPPSGRRQLTVRTVRGVLVGQDGRYGLVSLAAGAVTVYAGYSLAATDFAVADLELALAVGLPVLLAVVAAVCWYIVGRALRPIDAIRGEVAEITSRHLDRRVPAPKTGDELDRLAQTMNAMLDRLETASERQRAFVADASHELRSPLTALRVQLEVGLSGGASTDWTTTAIDALAEEQRLERLVTDLLALARLEADPDRPRAATADIAAVVVADLQGRSGPPAVSVDVPPGKPATASIGADLARRIVANLVDNARRHASSGVAVVVEESEGWIELTVSDDGPGVPAADRERVFERFTRLDDARTGDGGGAGLGLAIVREIVDRHGGTVRFVPVERGALVRVRLPRAISAPAPGADGSHQHKATHLEPTPLRRGGCA